MSTDEFDSFYGLKGDYADSSRQVILAFVAARCHRGAVQNTVTEEEILKSSCFEHLPSLKEIGLSAEDAYDSMLIHRDEYEGAASSRDAPFSNHGP